MTVPGSSSMTPRGNHFDQEKKFAYLSKIFDWFTDDLLIIPVHSRNMLHST